MVISAGRVKVGAVTVYSNYLSSIARFPQVSEKFQPLYKFRPLAANSDKAEVTLYNVPPVQLSVQVKLVSAGNQSDAPLEIGPGAVAIQEQLYRLCNYLSSGCCRVTKYCEKFQVLVYVPNSCTWIRLKH
jgi:hypothetical protein